MNKQYRTYRSEAVAHKRHNVRILLGVLVIVGAFLWASSMEHKSLVETCSHIAAGQYVPNDCRGL